MKIVPTNVQRVVMYIPFINFLNLFIGLMNIGKSQLTFCESVKSFVYFFGSILPIAGLYMIVSKLFPSLEALCYVIAVYGVPVSMSYWLIRFQEKYCFKKRV